jgi:hypothetical protein
MEQSSITEPSMEYCWKLARNAYGHNFCDEYFVGPRIKVRHERSHCCLIIEERYMLHYWEVTFALKINPSATDPRSSRRETLIDQSFCSPEQFATGIEWYVYQTFDLHNPPPSLLRPHVQIQPLHAIEAQSIRAETHLGMQFRSRLRDGSRFIQDRLGRLMLKPSFAITINTTYVTIAKRLEAQYIVGVNKVNLLYRVFIKQESRLRFIKDFVYSINCFI